MSNWIPTLGYDVARIDGQAMVLVRGGDYYNLRPDTLPAWRRFAVCSDLDDARRVAAALNETLK